MVVDAALGYLGGDLSVVPRLNEACRLDESCSSGSDMYADLCGAEGLRSDLRAHVCSCRHNSTDGWAVRHGNSNLAACRLKIWPSQDLSPGTPSRQYQKRRAHIPPLVLRLLPEGRGLSWPANQPTGRAAYCTQRRIRPSCSGFKFCTPRPATIV